MNRAFLDKLQQRARTVGNKLQEAVTDEKTQKISKAANALLQVAAHVGQAKLNGPLAIASLAVGTLNVVKESFDLQVRAPVTQWTDAHYKIQIQSGLPDLLHSTGADQFLGLKEIVPPVKEGAARIVGIEIDGKLLAYKLIWWGNAEAPTPFLYVDEGFPMEALRDALWSAMKLPIAKIALSLAQSSATGGQSVSTTLEMSDYDTQPYVGYHSPEEFVATAQKFLDRGMSRASVLSGPPGSGKTTFVRACARATRGKILVVTPGILDSGMWSEVERYVRVLSPDYILFDDIDHADSQARALSVVDDVRRARPKMLVIATCNDLLSDMDETKAALLRPGRLGEFLEFLAPDLEDRVAVLRTYLDEYHVDASRLDLMRLCRMMDHPRFTHDYVRFVAEQAVVLDQERLEKYIQIQIRMLGKVTAGLEDREPRNRLARIVKDAAGDDADGAPE